MATMICTIELSKHLIYTRKSLFKDGLGRKKNIFTEKKKIASLVHELVDHGREVMIIGVNSMLMLVLDDKNIMI